MNEEATAQEVIRTLVIDDNQTDVLLLKEMGRDFTQIKMNLESFSLLQDGIAFLKENAVDILFLDLSLPDSSGLDSLLEIVGLGLRCPIIVLTGMVDQNLAREAVSHGAQDYLNKGKLTPVLLERTIRYAIERQFFQDQSLENQRRLTRALQALQEGVWELDLSTNRIYLSETLLALSGNASQLEQRSRPITLFRSVQPENREDLSEFMKVFFKKTRNMAQREFQLISPDKKKTWVRLSGRCFHRNSQGKPVLITGTLANIEEERIYREELHLQSTALQSAANGILITDQDGAIIWCNQAFIKLYEYPIHEILGKNPRMIQSGLMPTKFFESMWKDLLAGKVWRQSIINKTRSGRLVQAETTITPIKDEKNSIYRFIAIYNDITEKSDLQEQFYHAQRMQGLGTLASGVAHDLNNILSPILIGTELLLRQNQDERNKKYLDIINRGALRGAEIVNQLLSFARGNPAQKSSFSIIPLAKEMVKMMKETFPRNISIQLKTENPLPDIFGDPSQIGQVILNLAVNARDAMPQGGTLSVCLKTDVPGLGREDEPAYNEKQEICIEVSDTGIGIPEDIKERIFEPFFTTKVSGKGTGLGLSTVAGIVKNHGGLVAVSSTPGRGSTFYVRIPAHGSDTPPLPRPSDPEDLRSGNHEVILIVDDEIGVLTTIEASIRSWGYQAVTAQSGEEAMDLLSRSGQDFDLLITDYDMPKPSGMDLLRYVQKTHQGLPFLLISGSDDLEDVQEKLGITSEYVLKKPFISQQLLAKIESCLKSTRNRPTP